MWFGKTKPSFYNNLSSVGDRMVTNRSNFLRFCQWLPLTNWSPSQLADTANYTYSISSRRTKTNTHRQHPHKRQPERTRGGSFWDGGMWTDGGGRGGAINSITREFYTFQKQTGSRRCASIPLQDSTQSGRRRRRRRWRRRLGPGPIARFVMSIALCGFNLWQNIWSTN